MAYINRNSHLSLIEVIRGIREILSDEARLGRDCWARDAEGNKLAGSDPAATCWSLTGAMWKVGADRAGSVAIALGFFGNHIDLADFGDTLSHPELLAKLDAAIETLSSVPVSEEARWLSGRSKELIAVKAAA